MAAPERREALLQAAAQWRSSVTSLDLPRVQQLAESAARNLERQAETGIATCVCCNKPFGQGTFQVR